MDLFLNGVMQVFVDTGVKFGKLPDFMVDHYQPENRKYVANYQNSFLERYIVQVKRVLTYQSNVNRWIYDAILFGFISTIYKL